MNDTCDKTLDNTADDTADDTYDGACDEPCDTAENDASENTAKTESIVTSKSRRVPNTRNRRVPKKSASTKNKHTPPKHTDTLKTEHISYNSGSTRRTVARRNKGVSKNEHMSVVTKNENHSKPDYTSPKTTSITRNTGSVLVHVVNYSSSIAKFTLTFRDLFNSDLFCNLHMPHIL